MRGVLFIVTVSLAVGGSDDFQWIGSFEPNVDGEYDSFMQLSGQVATRDPGCSANIVARMLDLSDPTKWYPRELRFRTEPGGEFRVRVGLPAACSAPVYLFTDGGCFGEIDASWTAGKQDPNLNPKEVKKALKMEAKKGNKDSAKKETVKNVSTKKEKKEEKKEEKKLKKEEKARKKSGAKSTRRHTVRPTSPAETITPVRIAPNDVQYAGEPTVRRPRDAEIGAVPLHIEYLPCDAENGAGGGAAQLSSSNGADEGSAQAAWDPLGFEPPPGPYGTVSLDTFRNHLALILTSAYLFTRRDVFKRCAKRVFGEDSATRVKLDGSETVKAADDKKVDSKRSSLDEIIREIGISEDGLPLNEATSSSTSTEAPKKESAKESLVSKSAGQRAFKLMPKNEGPSTVNAESSGLTPPEADTSKLELRNTNHRDSSAQVPNGKPVDQPNQTPVNPAKIKNKSPTPQYSATIMNPTISSQNKAVVNPAKNVDSKILAKSPENAAKLPKNGAATSDKKLSDASDGSKSTQSGASGKSRLRRVLHFGADDAARSISRRRKSPAGDAAAGWRQISSRFRVPGLRKKNSKKVKERPKQT